MAGIGAIEQFLATQPLEVNISSIILSMAVAVILSYTLAKLYVKYGTALSNRKKFADNFILLAITTTLVISIVKSSLALSLGLVGALSIVRFRAAIKEPEELVFLFLVIAIGLGLGANQILLTVVSFVFIALVILARHATHRKEAHQNLYLNISGQTKKGMTLANIKDILKKHCKAVHLRRFDHNSNDELDASFLIDIDSFDELEKIRNELKKLSKSINVTYLDKIGVH